MPWAAAAVVGGALISANASQSAADTQANAANNATQAQLQMYGQARQDLSPYVTSGNQALSRLSDLVGTSGNTGASGYGSLMQPFNADTFRQYQDPGYQFQLQQGQQALQNSQAAQDGVLSGAALKDLINYNQNFANTSFDNAFNRYQTQQGNQYQRLSGLVNLGQASAAGTAANAMTAGGNIGANTIAAGNAQAAGMMGSANAINGGINNAASMYMMSKMMGGGGITPAMQASQMPPSYLAGM